MVPEEPCTSCFVCQLASFVSLLIPLRGIFSRFDIGETRYVSLFRKRLFLEISVTEVRPFSCPPSGPRRALRLLSLEDDGLNLKCFRPFVPGWQRTAPLASCEPPFDSLFVGQPIGLFR